jgi:Leucine-rich repeat (LRR) protein
MDLDLTVVTRFQASSNQLTSLPTKIGQLTQLEWLSVRNLYRVERDLTQVCVLGPQ